MELLRRFCVALYLGCLIYLCFFANRVENQYGEENNDCIKHKEFNQFMNSNLVYGFIDLFLIMSSVLMYENSKDETFVIIICGVCLGSGYFIVIFNTLYLKDLLTSKCFANEYTYYYNSLIIVFSLCNFIKSFNAIIVVLFLCFCSLYAISYIIIIFIVFIINFYSNNSDEDDYTCGHVFDIFAKFKNKIFHGKFVKKINNYTQLDQNTNNIRIVTNNMNNNITSLTTTPVHESHILNDANII